MLSANTLLQNRYRIRRAIAKGGMGMVYEAEAVHLGNTLVAVKETFFDEDYLREQFEREASVLARLRHPALPKVTDHFSEGAGQFLVMEFIPGDDLEKLLKNRGAPFPVNQVLEWADRLLDALDYIHTQYPPVIHRDIKPSNLKLTPRGEILLLDFGLAKNATTPTRPGGSVHAYTQGYAPPEQIKGTGTDVRCDIYSLGATLYNLMTGEAPSDSKLRAEMMAVPMPDPLRPSHLLRADIPMPVSVVIARAMAVNREQRHPSAKAMRTALIEARQSIEQALIDEQQRKAEAARLLAEQAQLAEEARRRAAAETERAKRDEAERQLREEAAQLKKERDEIQRKLHAETARRQQEEAARLKQEREAEDARRQADAARKQKADAERREREAREKAEAERLEREAREKAEAERLRKEEDTRPRPKPVPPTPNKGGRRLAVVAAAILLVCLLGYLWKASQSDEGGEQIATGPTFEFETIRLDRNGKEVERRKSSARYFTEDLGKGVKLEMVEIPGGTFTMGSNEYSYEKPPHPVKVAPFWMGKFEITQAQWLALMGSNPSNFKGDGNLPVEQVSWNDAQEFLKKLNALPNLKGKNYRLPSEAEWEYAARAGTTTPFAFGETITPQFVNYDGNYPYANAPKGEYRGKTTPVGFFNVANAFGLFDMHGNVWEWCQDVWHDSYNGATSDGSAWLSGGDSSLRVLRGGSWGNLGLSVRSANRHWSTPGLINNVIGFRLVCART